MNKINSLKVLHILDHSLPLHSGYAFRSQNIFRAQRKRGVTPVAITSPKHEENWKGKWVEKEEIDGFSYYRTGPTGGTFPFDAELRIMRTLGRLIRKVANSENPDLLHAHSSILNAIPAIRVGRSMGIPVVYEIRAFWEDAAVDHGTYKQNSWKYRLVNSVETWVCRKADHVVALCNGLKDDLMKRGISPEKISIVSNGVSVEDFKITEPDVEYIKSWKLQGKKVIGFIGSFYRYEGLDLLVNAFAGLAKNRPDVVLLLVGGGEMKDELMVQIKRLGLENRVVMPGRIRHDRVPGIYALVDILAYPRYSKRITELVTPLKPLEAMAMGKALVASDIGGHRELIQSGRTGLLFTPGNASALKAALERILDERDLCKYLEAQGIDHVRKEYTWDKTTSVYTDVYSRALGRA